MNTITTDTVFASFESLRIDHSGPDGFSSPNTSAAVNQMFMLQFPTSGKVRTLMAPSFPKAISDIANLRLTFFDFFLPLPDEKLGLGVSWTDEVRETTLKGQNLYRKGLYTVVDDTLIDGVQAWVIDAAIDADLSWDTRDRSRGVDISVQLNGLDSSRFYFAPEHGKMIGRDSSANLKGTLKLSGGKKPITMIQTQSASGKIRLIR